MTELPKKIDRGQIEATLVISGVAHDCVGGKEVIPAGRRCYQIRWWRSGWAAYHHPGYCCADHLAAYLDRVDKLVEWVKSVCPICGKEYQHRAEFHPTTCGAFGCLQEASKRGILPK